MDRIRKTLVLAAVIGTPVAAHSTLRPAPEPLCFTSGTAVYRVAPASAAADIRVRIDNGATRPDLRIELADRPDTADFVLADDHARGPGGGCRAAAQVRTVKVDSQTSTPDVTVSLGRDLAAADYRIYVHSARYSHQDAAALLAAIWSASRSAKLAQRSTAPGAR